MPGLQLPLGEIVAGVVDHRAAIGIQAEQPGGGFVFQPEFLDVEIALPAEDGGEAAEETAENFIGEIGFERFGLPHGGDGRAPGRGRFLLRFYGCAIADWLWFPALRSLRLISLRSWLSIEARKSSHVLGRTMYGAESVGVSEYSKPNCGASVGRISRIAELPRM